MLATTFGEIAKKIIQVFFLVILALNISCVKKTQSKQNKIFDKKIYSVVNGVTAKPEQFPATVALVNEQGRAFCTGSIISYDLVMTAAHCVIEKLNKRFYIMYDCQSEASCNNYTQVIGMAIHPNYRHDMRNWNDIAILLLNKPIIMKKNVELLPENKYPVVLVPGKLVFVVGYGKSSDYGGAGILRYSIAIVEKIQGKELILGRDDTTKGNVCYGDSGSPLYVLHEGKQYIVGAASRLILKNRFNKEYCGGGSIYTLDGPYQKWITRAYGRLLSRYAEDQLDHMQAQPFSRCGIYYSRDDKGIGIGIFLILSFIIRRKFKCEKI